MSRETNPWWGEQEREKKRTVGVVGLCKRKMKRDSLKKMEKERGRREEKGQRDVSRAEGRREGKRRREHRRARGKEEEYMRTLFRNLGTGIQRRAWVFQGQLEGTGRRRERREGEGGRKRTLDQVVLKGVPSVSNEKDSKEEFVVERPHLHTVPPSKGRTREGREGRKEEEGRRRRRSQLSLSSSFPFFNERT